MIGLSFLVETLTIFDIVRNQYFYFTDELFGSVAQGIAAFIMVQLAAEVSDDGLEALTFGMLMTNWSISGSLASLLGNLISTPFHVIGWFFLKKLSNIHNRKRQKQSDPNKSNKTSKTQVKWVLFGLSGVHETSLVETA